MSINCAGNTLSTANPLVADAIKYNKVSEQENAGITLNKNKGIIDKMY